MEATALLLFLGKKNQGKTALARKVLWDQLAKDPKAPAICFDPMGQLRDGVGVVFPDVGAARAHLQTHGGLPRLTIFREESIDNVCELAWSVGDCVLFLDEMDHAFKRKDWSAPFAYKVSHYGRHRGILTLATFRYTRNVNEDLVSLADKVFIFHHSSASPFDLRTLGQRFGPDWPGLAVGLERFQFAVWEDL